MAYDVALFARVGDLVAGLVEALGVHRRLRKGEAPAREARLGVQLIATSQHADAAVGLDEHADGEAGDAVAGRIGLDHTAVCEKLAEKRLPRRIGSLVHWPRILLQHFRYLFEYFYECCLVSPAFAPLVAELDHLLESPRVAAQVLGNVEVGDAAAVVLVVELEQPALHDQVARDRQCQTLVKLKKQAKKALQLSNSILQQLFQLIRTIFSIITESNV